MNIHTCMQNILHVYILLSIAVEQERQRRVAKVHRCLQKYRKKRKLAKEKYICNNFYLIKLAKNIDDTNQIIGIEILIN